jgi:P-type Ca2+ transporter type 2C
MLCAMNEAAHQKVAIHQYRPISVSGDEIRMTEQGLTSDAASTQLAADGPNELPRRGTRPAWKIISEVLREPMFALLLIGGLVYLLLGNQVEAIILLGFASFSIVLTVVQETRTEHVLEALRDLSAPRALVIRDGQRVRIAGRDVVIGDILLLEQGDRIAADALLIEVRDLQVDESLMTGESVPVHKTVGAEAEAHRPGGDGQPYVYSGSLVVRGTGIARTIATGARSEIGKIGQSLATLDPAPPRLRAETARIVTWCAIGGSVIALLVVVLYGLLRGDWLQAVLAGIATGMAMLPEEFPVVLTIFLAMGAWRIGRARVLTRRPSAIETLGAATILCSDKTGTLTENQMVVVAAWLVDGRMVELDAGRPAPGEADDLLRTAALASAPIPTDPMEIAIHAAGLPDPDMGKLVHSYGLSPNLLAMSNIWTVPGETGRARIAAKGAPEAIAGLCGLGPEEAKAMTVVVDDMAARGIRVLGVATAEAHDCHWAASQTDYSYKLAGLIGLADPIRKSVPAAVAECRLAGIKVVMITGDYAATARAIAAQAGIVEGNVLTGPELEAMDAATLRSRLPDISVFARIMPEQKLRIVEAYKAAGEVVAMTGDGVNDAPSLKSAHIGIAMGKRGTDVAREASAIVLLDDDFGSIVQAIRLGRRIYDNIRKAMAFIFAVHVPLAGFALLPLLLGLPVLFGPIHIALIEMIIDPVCALVFEAERAEDDIMRRKPRNPEQPLFSVQMIGWSVFQGGLAFALLAVIFLIATWYQMPETDVRELVFLSLIVSIVALILANRSFDTSLLHAFTRKNVMLRYVLGAVLAVLALTVVIPAFRALLQFGSPSWSHLAAAFGIGGLLLALLEILKPYVNRQISSPRSSDLHYRVHGTAP